MNPRRLAALLRFLLPAVLTVLPMVAESATEASSVHRPLRIVFFTDIHTPEPKAAPERTPEPVRHERSAHDGKPSVSVKTGSLTGEGFQPDEEVVVKFSLRIHS